MANLNALFSEKMARIARKCIRKDSEIIRRLTAQHRRDIAALKRQLVDLQKTIVFLQRQEKRRAAAEPSPLVSSRDVRFRADGLKSHRKRLGLSAEDFGRLVGASGLSIYNWESGKSRPRKQFVGKIVSLRALGKREALRRLAMLGQNR